MSIIDLYQVLRIIHDVTDDQARQASAATEQGERLHEIADRYRPIP